MTQSVARPSYFGAQLTGSLHHSLTVGNGFLRLLEEFCAKNISAALNNQS